MCVCTWARIAFSKAAPPRVLKPPGGFQSLHKAVSMGTHGPTGVPVRCPWAKVLREPPARSPDMRKVGTRCGERGKGQAADGQAPAPT